MNFVSFMLLGKVRGFGGERFVAVALLGFEFKIWP